MQIQHRIAILAGFGLLLVIQPATAQTVFQANQAGDLVHYAYGNLFGTGYYQLDDRAVAIIQVPFGFQLREATREKFGMRIKIPTAVGLHNFEFDSVPELDVDSLATVSVLPGIEFSFLVAERWELDPAVYLGYGRDLSNDVNSIIYGAGVTSRYEFNVGKPQMTFGSDLIYNGYTPEDGSARFITRLGLGLDAKVPTRWTIGDSNMFIGTHFTIYHYLNEIDFETIGGQDITVRNEIEVGLALGKDPMFKIFGFSFDRIGLSYRFSDETNAILLNTGFPF